MAAARQAFHRVFRMADPFGAPFQAGVASRLLVYCPWPDLGENLLAGLCGAALAQGDGQAYFSITGAYAGEAWEVRPHWEIDLPADPYEHLRSATGQEAVYETALYSPGGTWGVLVSRDIHALIGGTRGFMRELSARIPAIESEVHELICRFRQASDGSNPAWLQPLLRHVYGPERARRLLELGER